MAHSNILVRNPSGITRNELLKNARLSRGWTQAQVASRIRVHKKTYQKWERGRTTPRPAHVCSLCAWFRSTAQELGLPAIYREAYEGEDMPEYRIRRKRVLSPLCKNGHPRTPENRRRNGRDGKSYCIICRRERQRSISMKVGDKSLVPRK